MGILTALIPAAAIAVRFNKKIEETMAPATMIILLIIYLPGLWTVLTFGYAVGLAVIAGSAVYCAYVLFRNRQRLIDSLATWGMAAFVIYAAFFAYYSLHRDFSHPDELYCWGLMAKNYYYYDSMFSPLSTALSADQTPLMPILGYFSAKSWIGFSDSACYFGQDIFTISLLLPVFAHVRSKINAPVFLLVTAAIPSLFVISGLEAFRYVLGDMVIAGTICFFVINIVRYAETDEHYYYVTALISLCSMCLTKRLGPVYASLCVFMAVPICIRSSVMRIRELSGLMAAISIVTFSWFGISVYDLVPIAGLLGGVALYWGIGRLGRVSGRYREAFTVAIALGIIGVIFGFMILVLGRSSYGYAVMARFMQDLFKVTTEDGYICLSYGLYTVIAFVMALTFRYLGRARTWGFTGEEAAGNETLFAWTGIAMAVFSLFMLTMHIWQIGPMNDNMEGLIPRYMIPWEILTVFLVAYAFLRHVEEIKLIPLVIGVLAIMLVSDSGELYRQMFAKHQCVGYYALSDAGITLEAGDMVYFIDEQNYFTYSDREFYYRSWPARTNFIDQIFMGNNGRVQFTAEELERMIASDQYLEIPYDYLYLQTIDDDFADRYASLFENPYDIAPGSAYYVFVDGDHVRLRSVKSGNGNAD